MGRRFGKAMLPSPGIIWGVSAQSYRSVFAPSARRERHANFEAYWAYTVSRDGNVIEDEKDLETTRSRQRARGANTPWQMSRLVSGRGVIAAKRSRNSRGRFA